MREKTVGGIQNSSGKIWPADSTRPWEGRRWRVREEKRGKQPSEMQECRQQGAQGSCVQSGCLPQGSEAGGREAKSRPWEGGVRVGEGWEVLRGAQVLRETWVGLFVSLFIAFFFLRFLLHLTLYFTISQQIKSRWEKQSYTCYALQLTQRKDSNKCWYLAYL